jgi:beta-phosphoglucomutase-like phosphatase (HAD superfamily)
MRFQGAIFDIDGVLIDSPHERAWRDSLNRLMAGPWQPLATQLGYQPEHYTSEVYQALVAGKPRQAGAQAALAHFGIADPDGDRTAQYAAAKQIYLLELAEQGEFRAFSDGLRLVTRLQAIGIRLAAASSSKNANMFLRQITLDDGSDLLEAFSANVCGRDFVHGKPHPEIFLTAAAELGLMPGACFVIEDAASGIQAARAAGMFAIGIARLDDADLLEAAGADLVVQSLDELVLEPLLSKSA